MSHFKSYLDEKLQDFEEKLNEKANKSSVAQALHRKANKGEIDTCLASKAELNDIKRLYNQLDNKIDLQSFEDLMKVVENKMDRGEALRD